MSDAVLRGQPFPLVLLAFVAAAFFVHTERPRAAALCVLATAIQPHVALPVVLGALIFIPAMRGTLAFGAAALALVSVAATGLGVTVSYVRDVLPVHALANAYEWQFSLTSLLTSAGVAPRTAIVAGSIAYVVMTAVGIAAAARFVRRDRDPVAALLVPVAFSMFLGVHVHYHQLAFAFPAMVYVGARYQRWRALAAASLVVVMIPWDTIVVPALVVVWAALTFVVGRDAFGIRSGLAIGVGTLVFAAAVSVAASIHPAWGAGPPPFVPHPYPPGALAAVSWADFSRQELQRTSPLLFALRVPTFVGLALGLTAIAGAAFASPGRRGAHVRVPAEA